MSRKYRRKDRLYRAAKAEGYRSRAAYKLLELDERYSLLRPGMTVVDLGCFPGGWLQVALAGVAPKGRVVGIDLREVEPVVRNDQQALILKGDISDPEMLAELGAAVGHRADLVLSDMSPKLSGIRFRDQARSAALVETAFYVSQQLLTEGGAFVAKIFPGTECEELAPVLREHFASFSRRVLKSSRGSSKEVYFVCRGFLGKKNW